MPFEKARVKHPFSDVDLSSDAFWASPFDEREKSFAQLRREDPISFHPPVEVDFEHNEKGFWAVTRAEDISHIARNDDVFLSELGISLGAYPVLSTSFFHLQDGESHKKNRALVSSAFTPKRISLMLGQIRDTATEIVDDLVGAGDVDFVEACSARLPSITGARILGIPEEYQEGFAHASNMTVGAADPEYGDPDDPVRSKAQGFQYTYDLGKELAAHRRKHPKDDLLTELVQAEVDGQKLTDNDIGGFTQLMSVASNDTTKQTTTHTIMALSEHPDQLAWLLEDYEGRSNPAVGEFLRWATPVIHHARTANRDVEFGGRQIAKGDKVVLFYSSGNRDERRFDSPERFDLSRDPNPHIAFGGGGVHYCLGSRLATAMLKELFGELLQRTTVAVTGPAEYMVSNQIYGIRHLPVHIA